MDGMQDATTRRGRGRPAGKILIDVDAFKAEMKERGAESPREMAKLLGVGDSTISKLLSHKQGTSQAFRDLVADEFGPEAAARIFPTDTESTLQMAAA